MSSLIRGLGIHGIHQSSWQCWVSTSEAGFGLNPLWQDDAVHIAVALEQDEMLQVLLGPYGNWHRNCERGLGLVTLKITIRSGRLNTSENRCHLTLILLTSSQVMALYGSLDDVDSSASSIVICHESLVGTGKKIAMTLERGNHVDFIVQKIGFDKSTRSTMQLYLLQLTSETYQLQTTYFEAGTNANLALRKTWKVGRKSEEQLLPQTWDNR